MKVPRGLVAVFMCIGLLLAYSTRAQEEPASQDSELEQEQQVPQEQGQPQEEPAAEQPADSETPAQEPSGQDAPEQEVAQEEPAVEQADQEKSAEESPAQDTPEQEGQDQPAESAEQPTDQESPAQEPSEQDVSQEEQQPQEPEVPEEPEIPMPPDEIMGLDTVDLEDPQGNWLFKRVWWERAEEKYEKIRALVTQIMEQRAGFFEKRSELDKNTLDPFYIDIGFKRGELTEKINDLIADLKAKESSERSDTDAFEKLQKNRKELEELAKQVEKVTKQDEAVEKALLQLVGQINTLRNYEQQAWQDFKDIARVLDDKKARELFYKVDNAWQNVQKVQEYIAQTFTGSFDSLIQDVSKQIAHIKDEVAALKEQGVALYKQVTGHDDVDQDEDDDEPAPERTRAWLDALMDMVARASRAIIALVRWPYDLIMGTATPAEPESDQESIADELETPVQAEGQSSDEVPTIPEPPSQVPAEPAEKELEVDISETVEQPTAPEVSAVSDVQPDQPALPVQPDAEPSMDESAVPDAQVGADEPAPEPEIEQAPAPEGSLAIPESQPEFEQAPEEPTQEYDFSEQAEGTDYEPEQFETPDYALEQPEEDLFDEESADIFGAE